MSARYFLAAMLVALLALPIAEAKTKKTGHLKKVTSSKSVKKTSKTAKSSKKKEAADPNERLSRDIVFDGSTVVGRYHSPGEGIVEVENEKKLNELIGFRKDFKDRLSIERGRLSRGEPAPTGQ